MEEDEGADNGYKWNVHIEKQSHRYFTQRGLFSLGIGYLHPPPFQTLRLRNIHSYRIPRHIYTRACNRKGMDPGYVRTALKKADVQILCPARILLQSVPPHQLLTAPAPKSHAHTFVSCICRSSRATGRRHWLAHSTNRSNGCMA